ncbi:hypothetical protein ACTJJB_03805 [Chitinophaga sp. 22536]|uniref:hypothetical protein n=1 Tax=unclassified Chitinophaga TaxID=2619133 RepID=UPI003F82A5BC
MKEPVVMESAWARDLYWANKLISWILLLSPATIVLLIALFEGDAEDVVIFLLLLTGVCAAAVVCRFTTVLSIEGDRLKVEYVQYFRRRNRYFSIAGTVVEVRKYDGIMGKGLQERPPHYWLQIVQNGELKWHLDSRRGFQPEKMLRFVQAFAVARASS